MPNHHRLPQGGLDPCLESDLAQSAGAALSRFNAGFMVNGVGRDAWNGEQPEQPLKGCGLFPIEAVEHALQRAAGNLRFIHRHASPRTQPNSQ
jgi:hypothetical protein